MPIIYGFKFQTEQMINKSNRYSERQNELHNYIKNLHETGMSYRRITKHLNDKGINTHTGIEWGETETLFTKYSRSIV